MSRDSIWSVLGIAATREVGDIRRAYAARLKVTNPEDDAEGFRQLREAYDTALALARSRTPAFADGDDDWPRDEGETEGETGAEDKSWGQPANADAPSSPEGASPEGSPPEGSPPGGSPAGAASSVDYDGLWRRLEALVFAAEPPEPKTLVAALEAVLFHPRLEALGAYLDAEQRTAALIARGAPRTDPLIAPARARFDWLALAEQRTVSPSVLQAMSRERQAQQEAAVAALEALLGQSPPPPEHALDRALNDVTKGALADEAVWFFTEAELCRLVLQHAPRLDDYIGAIGAALGWSRRYADGRVPEVTARFEALQARRRLSSPGHRLHQAWTIVQQPPARTEALRQLVDPRRHGRIRRMLAALRSEQQALRQDISAKTLRAWDDYFHIARVNPFVVALLALFALLATTCALRQGGEQVAGAAHYYPQAALAAGVRGEVTLRCAARYDGQLGSCEAIYEAPPGHGFAQAAQDMARDGRLRTHSYSPHSWERFDARLTFIPAGAGHEASIRMQVREAPAAEHAPDTPPPPGFVEVRGTVKLRCLRGTDGGFSQCQALSETPAGVGLGDLAVNYAQDGVLKGPSGPPGWVDFVAPVRAEVAAPTRRPAAPVAVQIDGRVVLSCLAEPSGHVSQCGVLWQSPAGAGLGARALADARSGRITIARGAISSARRVKVDVVFGAHPPPLPSAMLARARAEPPPGSIPLDVGGESAATPAAPKPLERLD